MSDAQWGAWLYNNHGCVACHSLAGLDGIGPALNEIAGTERPLVDGSTALADTSYLQTALLEPEEHHVAGFGAVMPNYTLSYAQIDALVAYLQYLAGVQAAEDE